MVLVYQATPFPGSGAGLKGTTNMCRTHSRPNPIFCILPPYLLRAVAQHGSDAQRHVALDTLITDTTFRVMRTLQEPQPILATGIASAVLAEGQKQRTIYTANNSQALPGDLVRAEGAPASGDAAVDEAYDGFGAVFDFFWEVFARNSIDDQGLPMIGTVHFSREYNNAFWDGQRMMFGDGDGDLFNRFTLALDVIGHELMHGVTQDEAKLAYLFQAGALNESLSDVFGALAKQYTLKQTADEASWLIGEELFTDKVQGTALRSMKAPGSAYDDPVLGKDPQPAHMDDLVRTYQDNGGVHINSGIPNHAFYLAATALGGFAWEKAGAIWYRALRDSRVRPSTGFLAFARRTTASATALYGQRSAELQAVREAWQQVGIKDA